MGKLKAKPKPSRLIEVFIRLFAIVVCAGVVVAAAFSINKLVEIDNHQFSGAIKSGIDQLSPDVRKMTEAVVAVAIVSAVFIPLEIVVVILRLLKLNLKTFGRIIVILDLLLILLAVCGFGVAGVLGSITAKDWSEDVINFVQSILDQLIIIPPSIREAVTADIKELRTAIAATAACSLLACGSCAVLLLFVIVLLVKHNRLDYTDA